MICPGSCPPNPDANIIANTLNIISDEFRNYHYATINANNFNVTIFSFQRMISTTKQDFTITDSATFDIGNDFRNAFYFNGYQNGGNIHANNFNVVPQEIRL